MFKLLNPEKDDTQGHVLMQLFKIRQSILGCQAPDVFDRQDTLYIVGSEEEKRLWLSARITPLKNGIMRHYNLLGKMQSQTIPLMELSTLCVTYHSSLKSSPNIKWYLSKIYDDLYQTLVTTAIERNLAGYVFLNGEKQHQAVKRWGGLRFENEFSLTTEDLNPLQGGFLILYPHKLSS